MEFTEDNITTKKDKEMDNSNGTMESIILENGKQEREMATAFG